MDNNTANAAAEAEQPELRRRRDRRRGEDSDARTGTMPITPSDAVDTQAPRPPRRNSWAEAAEAADERNAATGAVPLIRQVPAAPQPPAAPPVSATPDSGPVAGEDGPFDEEALEDFGTESPAFEMAAPLSRRSAVPAAPGGAPAVPAPPARATRSASRAAALTAPAPDFISSPVSSSASRSPGPSEAFGEPSTP
ncbi:hypothetical protein PJ267_18455 [Arthrobacter sp. OVS8]|nr:hypothetical protein PJ267_18455 [Arthrobacter sp. OVS8]